MHVNTCILASCQYMMYCHLMTEKNDKQFQMRVSDEFLKLIDDWRRSQPDLPARAEAIRRLVELGLKKSKAK